jgi:hypothetical protein
MSSPTLTVRALNPITWDPLCGNGQNNFISNRAAAAQILAQRLKLFEGEWWENLLDGLPLFQKILGSSGSQKNLQVVIGLISQRITTTVTPSGQQLVTQILSIVATYQDRKFAFNAEVETIFGVVYLTNAPASQAIV